MKTRFFMTISILVIILAVIWLALFRRSGVELMLIALSIVFAAFTMFLIFLHERDNKGK